MKILKAAQFPKNSLEPLTGELTIQKSLCFLHDRIYGSRHEICIEVKQYTIGEINNSTDSDTGTLHLESLCTPFTCKNGLLQIQFGNNSHFTCSSNDTGKFVLNSALGVKIVCPSFKDFCGFDYSTLQKSINSVL